MVRNVLRYEGAISIDLQGHSGGLALFWSNNNEVMFWSYSENNIDVVVEIDGWKNYRMMGVYGEPDKTKRRETWNLFRSLKNIDTLPWCLIGDFNNILSHEDKRGGRLYPHWLVQGFQRVVEECDLNDIEMEGY